MAYIKGELQATDAVSMAQAWDASITAIYTMQLTVDTQTSDALGGDITAQRADHTPVRVKLKPVGDFRTDIGVRVGGRENMWNRNDAQLVHNAIQQQLDMKQS